MNTAQKIVTALNGQRAIDNGLSNGDAKIVDGNTIAFTYPAPMISGCNSGSLVIASDGSIFDDTMGRVHRSFDAFLSSLNEMMVI